MEVRMTCPQCQRENAPWLALLQLLRHRLQLVCGFCARVDHTECLTTATTMYRKMDMRFWLEQATGEMAGPQ